MQDENDSWRIFSRGLMLSHLEPRISMMTVKPCLHTSSLGWAGMDVQREWEELKRKKDGEGGCEERREARMGRDLKQYNPKREGDR